MDSREIAEFMSQDNRAVVRVNGATIFLDNVDDLSSNISTDSNYGVLIECNTWKYQEADTNIKLENYGDVYAVINALGEVFKDMAICTYGGSGTIQIAFDNAILSKAMDEKSQMARLCEAGAVTQEMYNECIENKREQLDKIPLKDGD